jgi:hypothetical protein
MNNMKNKTFPVMLAFCAVTFITLKSCFQKKTKITFVNNSSIEIDSVVFFFNNYKYKMLKIPDITKKTAMVYPFSIQMNSHDIVIKS